MGAKQSSTEGPNGRKHQMQPCSLQQTWTQMTRNVKQPLCLSSNLDPCLIDKFTRFDSQRPWMHSSISGFPQTRIDPTLKVCISIWEADMKILVTPPTAAEYLLNMLCVYANFALQNSMLLTFAKCRRAHWDPSNLCYWHLRIYSVAPLSSVPMTCALDHTAWTIQGSSLPRLWNKFW